MDDNDRLRNLKERAAAATLADLLRGSDYVFLTVALPQAKEEVVQAAQQPPTPPPVVVKPKPVVRHCAYCRKTIQDSVLASYEIHTQCFDKYGTDDKPRGDLVLGDRLRRMRRIQSAADAYMVEFRAVLMRWSYERANPPPRPMKPTEQECVAARNMSIIEPNKTLETDFKRTFGWQTSTWRDDQ